MTFSLTKKFLSADGARAWVQWELKFPESEDDEFARSFGFNSPEDSRKDRNNDSGGQKFRRTNSSSDDEPIDQEESKRHRRGRRHRRTRDSDRNSADAYLPFDMSDEDQGQRSDHRNAKRSNKYRKSSQDRRQNRDQDTRPRSGFYQPYEPERKQGSRRSPAPSVSSETVYYVHPEPDRFSPHRHRNSREYRGSNRTHDETNASPLRGGHKSDHGQSRTRKSKNAERDREDVHQKSKPKRNPPPSLDGSSDGKNRKRSHVEFDWKRMAYVRRYNKD